MKNEIDEQRSEMGEIEKEMVSEEIGSTNKIIDKVNEDLESYPAWVDAIKQRQGEELGFCQCQGGSLVQKLETRVREQELVLADKGLWEPQLNGERMDEMLQEQLNTWDNAIKGEEMKPKSFC